MGGRLHPYRKDRWRLLFIFVVFQIERKTVMTKPLQPKEVSEPRAYENLETHKKKSLNNGKNSLCNSCRL